MQTLKQACGPYETDCYILNTSKGDFIIDPSVNALSSIKQYTKKPLAILNTHEHYDHVWNNARVKKESDIPIYIHKNDEFMLQDPFGKGFEPSKADVLIESGDGLEIPNTRFKFHFLPGHTPGCTMIELIDENLMFSGDSLSYRSIGRWDSPYSDVNLMKQSLEKVMTYKGDFRLLPGHGQETDLRAEQVHLPSWFRYF